VKLPSPRNHKAEIDTALGWLAVLLGVFATLWADGDDELLAILAKPMPLQQE
jgi:hypothetical protein